MNSKVLISQPPIWKILRKKLKMIPYKAYMEHHHTGRLTGEIISRNISMTEELDEPETTTCPLPNGLPEVLT
ncbi:hypothetical protein NPIL_484631 [Nephila pilipes]|uniref:Uncharacterized protein n=1 Tax=Nephila pilipes TaxID=299642 RepID=A0A8X6U6A1_NEPPI|nr:hypothetical protein NPIL_484631 [Nephila pilipes]